jgi:hypothetical protein
VTAITFPRAYPINSLALEGAAFSLVPMVNVQPNAAGSSLYTDIGPQLWQASYRSRELDPASLGDVRAFLDTLNGGQTFLGFDPLREYPVSHAAGWGSLTWPGTVGAGALVSKTGAFELALNGLANGLTLKPGDYLSWILPANVYNLHRIVATTPATGIVAGNAISIEVRPAIRNFTAATACNLFRAACTMQILPGSVAENLTSPDLCVIGFDAKQVI